MTLRKTIKRNARGSLRGMWGTAALILLIFMGVSLALGLLDTGIMSALGYVEPEPFFDPFTGDFYYTEMDMSPGGYVVSAIMQIISLIVIVPLSLGVVDWALSLTDGCRKPVGHIFWAYDNKAFGRSIWMSIVVSVKTCLFGILVLLPSAVLLTLGYLLPAKETISYAAGQGMIVVGWVLMVAGVVLSAWFGARYFLTTMLLCDRYYYKVSEAVRLSVRATRGRRWQIVAFELSFLPWFLLCVFVFPVFYVIPYCAVASVLYARFLFEDHLMRERQLDLSHPEALVVDDLTPERYEDARAESGLPEPAPETASAAQEEPRVESFDWTPPAPPAEEEDPEKGDFADL